MLSNFAESDLEAQSMVEALHQTLQELGWVEGRNLRFDHRWAAGNSTRIQAFAKALVALQPDVIVGHVTPAVAALQKETSLLACPIELSRARGSLLRSSLPGCYVLQTWAASGRVRSRKIDGLLTRHPPGLRILGVKIPPTIAIIEQSA